MRDPTFSPDLPTSSRPSLLLEITSFQDPVCVLGGGACSFQSSVMCIIPPGQPCGGEVHSLGIIEGGSERARDHSAESSASVLLPSDLLESSTEHVPQSWGCSLLPPQLAGLVEHVMPWAWTAGLAGEGTRHRPGLGRWPSARSHARTPC